MPEAVLSINLSTIQLELASYRTALDLALMLPVRRRSVQSVYKFPILEDRKKKKKTKY